MFLHVNCCINLFSSHDTAATEIYTLSLHDALPIYDATAAAMALAMSRSSDTVSAPATESAVFGMPYTVDRKSTRLNSSHGYISYTVFCLKKKNCNGQPAHFLKPSFGWRMSTPQSYT